jgi:hypothetical protein
MPTFTHSEANALTFDDSTPAKTVTGWAPMDAGANAFFVYANIQLSIAWGGSGDGNATIKVRTSADSGTTDSTVSIDYLSVTYAAGTTKVVTIHLKDFNFAEIGIYNGNTAAEDITISGKWEGLVVTGD